MVRFQASTRMLCISNHYESSTNEIFIFSLYINTFVHLARHIGPVKLTARDEFEEIRMRGKVREEGGDQ